MNSSNGAMMQESETDKLWKMLEDQRREIELLNRQLAEERNKVEVLLNNNAMPMLQIASSPPLPLPPTTAATAAAAASTVTAAAAAAAAAAASAVGSPVPVPTGSIDHLAPPAVGLAVPVPSQAHLTNPATDSAASSVPPGLVHNDKLETLLMPAMPGSENPPVDDLELGEDTEDDTENGSAEPSAKRAKVEA